jgi:peptide chain release factor subunit 1
MERLDVELVRSLARVRAERTAVSCYLGLDPSVVPNDRALATHVTSLVDDARASGASDDEADRIERFLTTELDRDRIAGVGIFLSETPSVAHEIALAEPVDDGVHVARSFVLAPLLPQLERGRDVVLVAVGRDRGSIWLVRDGRTRDLDELSRDGQSQHDQGGWSQARYARARDKEALDHMREVAAAIATAISQGSTRLLAIACLEEQRSSFEELLAPHVREALIGWIDFESHAAADDLLLPVERLLDEHIAREQNALVERWREERGQRSGRATDSWETTLAAAADGSVESLLLLDGRGGDAFECPQCGRGYVAAGTCDLDGTTLEQAPGGAREVAARATLLNGGEVRVLDAGLDGADVAALLRYPQPA